MPDSDDMIDTLREMAADESLTPSQRLRAIEELGRRSPPEPPRPKVPADASEAMAALVDRLCPQPPEMAGVPPDPMRDLDAAEQLRRAGNSRPIDPSIWTWLPFCPE